MGGLPKLRPEATIGRLTPDVGVRGCEGCQDGPGRASYKEGESWEYHTATLITDAWADCLFHHYPQSSNPAGHTGEHPLPM
jgi:hypothetical protein